MTPDTWLLHAFELASSAQGIAAPDGHWVQTNTALSRLLHTPASTLVGQSLEDFTHPDDHPTLSRLRQRLIQGESTQTQSELRCLHPDGQPRRILLRQSLVRSPEGQPVCFLDQIEEIHERRQTDAETHDRSRGQLLEKIAAAMDASLEGMAILEGETYVHMNPAHAKLYGYQEQELIGSPWTRIYSPAEAERLKAEVFPILGATGHWTGETRGLRKDGSEITADISLTLSPNGNLICCCRDTTLRHRHTEMIRRSQEQLSLVLAATQDGFWDFNIASKSIVYSDRWHQILGFQPGELGNQNDIWSTRIHPKDAPLVLQESNRMLSGQTPSIDLDYRLQRKDGGWVWVNDRGRVVERDESGHPLRAVGALSDITERRMTQQTLQRRTEELLEANAALARAAQGRDEFLARVSHELRTPLTSIMTLTEMLMEPENGPLNERQNRYVNTILSSSHHLLQLINDVLDIARLEAGQLKVELAAVDCDEVLADSVRLIRPQASIKKLGLMVNNQSPGLTVQADALRLKQIFVNLLGNAVKFTPAGGQVRADVLHEEGQAVFRISDTGIGIPKERLSTLFQPFVQLDSGLNRRFAGSGLGLAIVKHFADLHGGSVSVETELDKGSCFTVRIPLANQQPNTSANPEPAPTTFTTPLHHARSKTRVLIVDDDDVNRNILAENLRAAGFHLLTAGDGHTALRIIEEVIPDVIILDVQMPGLDGLEVTRRIRTHSNSWIATTPVLGLTALAMPEDRQICLNAGMTIYQSKPVALKALREMVHNLALDRRKTGPQPATTTSNDVD